MTTRIRSADAVQNALNEKFDEMFHRSKDGSLNPFVCICCDSVLNRNNLRFVSREVLLKNAKNLMPSDYNKVGNDNLESKNKFPHDKEGYHTKMKTMMLSPRAVFVNDFIKKRKGFSCCDECIGPLKRAGIPPFFRL